MRHRQEGPRLIGYFLEVDQAASLAYDVEQIAMLSGCGIGPYAGRPLAGLAAFQPHEHRSAGAVADIAHQPIAALAMAGRQIMAAHRLGLSAETNRQFGGVVSSHHAAPRSPLRSPG